MFLYKKNVRYLNWGKLRICGKNNRNKVILYHRGGGHKKRYRIIDMRRYLWNVFGIVNAYIYDNIRSNILLSVIYTNGILSYLIAFEGVFFGYYVFSTDYCNAMRKGYCLLVSQIVTGNFIFNVELYYNKGAQYVRASGMYARISVNVNGLCLIKLRSKYLIRLSMKYASVSVGQIKKFNYFLENNKASFYLRKGWRPVVRGIAMNPVDHPHGGGQGKTSGGRPSCNFYGFYSKGKKTRNLKNRRNFGHMKKLK